MTTRRLPWAALAYRPDADNPYPALTALRERAPVARWDRTGGWAVSSYELAQAALRSADFAKDPPGAQHDGPAIPVSTLKSTLRRERIERLRAEIVDLSDKLAGQCVRRPTYDVLRHLAYPLTTGAICSLLGVPCSDREMVMPWARRLAPLFDGVEPQAQSIQPVIGRFNSYFSALTTSRAAHPKDDAISDLIAAGASIPAVPQAALFLFLAGQETTMNLIGNAALALIRHPEQLDLLRADPAEIPSAVEEVLRWDPPLQRNIRVAQVDTELGGQQIRAGEVLYVLVGATNRDPHQVDHPDDFDVSRSPNPHLTFGYGEYFCYGAALARLEAHLAIAALLRHGCDWDRVNVSYRWRRMANFRGLQELEITGRGRHARP